MGGADGGRKEKKIRQCRAFRNQDWLAGGCLSAGEMTGRREGWMDERDWLSFSLPIEGRATSTLLACSGAAEMKPRTANSMATKPVQAPGKGHLPSPNLLGKITNYHTVVKVVWTYGTRVLLVV